MTKSVESKSQVGSWESCHTMLTNRHNLSKLPSLIIPSKITPDMEEASNESSSDEEEQNYDSDAVEELKECKNAEEFFDEYLWEVLCANCLRNDWSIYECMFENLTLYHELENDGAYEEIMEDVEKLERKCGSFTDALDKAIETHGEMIEQLVDGYRKFRGELPSWKNEHTIWRRLAYPKRYGCDSYTLTECNCKWNSCSLMERFRKFALKMHAMEIDCLMQNIIEAVRERPRDVTLDEALDKEIKAREVEIVEKFKDAKARLDSIGNDEKTLRKRWGIKENKQ